MRDILNRIAILAVALFALSSCAEYEELYDVTPGEGGSTTAPSSIITPSCYIENQSVTRAQKLGLTTRSLIDQITTKQLDSNFLRIDEDMDQSLQGQYTFTGGVENTPYRTNWNKANVLEATIISSPDNTDELHYRSVSLAPIQQYSMHIVKHKDGDEVISDTVSFHHTRMIGWYPKNCKLPKDNKGNLVTTQFDAWDDFNTVRINEQVDINNDGQAEDIIGLHFQNFNGETDIMVSNVCEAQAWHKYNPSNPHQSDIHPVIEDSIIYRYPFGHNFFPPVYSNYITYRHYRSAIRVTAYADQSSQCLSMWGEIQDVIIRNQPTSCKIWLPTELGDFGEVYEWGDRKNHPIVRTAMFGDDSNHPEYHEEAKYPISMEGTSLKDDVYLGYSLIEPNSDLELEVHTLSGVYRTVIKAHHIHKYEDGTTEEIELFDPGYIYHITLNFGTSGTISAILEKEGNERYYDLTLLHEYDLDTEEGKNDIEVLKVANCYVIDPTVMKVKNAKGEHILDANGNKIPWDGYCFLGTIVGNGKAGIISSGSQKFYPLKEQISPVSAHLLWESELGLVTNVELKYGYVRFKVPKGESARGNAVIAVYDKDDNILWSWHIWITDTLKPVEIQLGEGEHHTITMLDRNLGATRATCNSGAEALETYGLYYQWGRKDPSMGPESYNYSLVNLITSPYYDFSSDKKTAAEVAQFAEPTLKDAIENPMYLILPSTQTQNYSFNWLHERYDFLWGYNMDTGMTSKTIYDPCPYGYRVPSSELNHIFTDPNGTGSAGDYGYTRQFGNQELFFPYAGYKGVDVGMTSVSLPWKYVGQKGDYQSSMYCTKTDDYIENISHFMHRERIYISKEQSWNELNVGGYNAYMTPCYANRRTAAPVRCVRDEMIGSIRGSVSVDANTLVPGATVNIQYRANSYGSAIEVVTIYAQYTPTSGGDPVKKELREVSNYNEYNIEGTVPYHVPNDCNDDGITFKLIVKNEHGLTYSDDVELMKVDVKTQFLQWKDVNNDNINNSTLDYVIVGQKIRYYVGVRSSIKPTSVTIDGKTATELTDYNVVPQPTGSETYRTVWYIDWSSSTKGTYDMKVSVVVDGTTINKLVGNIKVAGLSLSDAISNKPTQDGSTIYVMQNTNPAYTNTYCTSENNNLSAKASYDYYSLFTFENGRIRSLAKGTYCNGTSTWNGGSISFSTNGTTYTFNNNGKITYGSNYIRQTSATNIGLSGTDNNNNTTWQFIPISYDVP